MVNFQTSVGQYLDAAAVRFLVILAIASWTGSLSAQQSIRTQVTDPMTLRVPAEYSTIQAGIDAARNGDTVLVAPGTYVEVINFKGKAIKVIGQEGARETILDANLGGYVCAPAVAFWVGEDQNSVFRGFTVQNSKPNGTVYRGAAFMCVPPTGETPVASPLIQDCIVRDCQSAGLGGAYYGDPFLERCIFFRNAAAIDGGAGGTGNWSAMGCTYYENCALSGGGAAVENGITGTTNDPTYSVTLNDCLFIGNGAYYSAHGGAMYLSGSSLQTQLVFGDVGGSIFAANFTFQDVYGNAQGGGAIQSSGTNLSLFIDRSTFFGNWEYANFDNSPYWGGVLAVAQITNSILWLNRGIQVTCLCGTIGAPDVQYSDIMGGFAGTGNLAVDAQFVDPLDFDFHLLATSPAIDSGDPASGLDPDGTVADMGAYPFNQNAGSGMGGTQTMDPYSNTRLPTLREPQALRQLIEDLVAEDSTANLGAMHGPLLRPVLLDTSGAEAEGTETLVVELIGVPNAVTTLTLAEDMRDLDVLPLVPQRPASSPIPAQRTINTAQPLAVMLLDDRGKATQSIPLPEPDPVARGKRYYLQAQSKSPRFGVVGSSRVLTLIVGESGQVHFLGAGDRPGN